MRWDPWRATLHRGAWLHGTIYPQRCDLSPDGRWLVYFALKAGARWDVGQTWIAVSRLPWLTALAAWSTCGTWTRGLHFVSGRRQGDPGTPDHGDLQPLLRRYGLAATRPGSFAVERRNGWSESADTPARMPSDAWDEQRAEHVVMEKPRPDSADVVLRVAGRHAAFRTGGPAWDPARYTMAAGGDPVALGDVQWADWDRRGRLLVATIDGRLEVRERAWQAADAVWSSDVTNERPDPTPPPPEARRWT